LDWGNREMLGSVRVTGTAEGIHATRGDITKLGSLWPRLQIGDRDVERQDFTCVAQRVMDVANMRAPALIANDLVRLAFADSV
jgi:hypothetical protein